MIDLAERFRFIRYMQSILIYFQRNVNHGWPNIFHYFFVAFLSCLNFSKCVAFVQLNQVIYNI